MTVRLNIDQIENEIYFPIVDQFNCFTVDMVFVGKIMIKIMGYIKENNNSPEIRKIALNSLSLLNGLMHKDLPIDSTGFDIESLPSSVREKVKNELLPLLKQCRQKSGILT